MYKVYFTQRAIADLRSIQKYSKDNWGEEIANSYIQKIETATNLISSSPNILHKKKELSDHLLFYRTEKHLLVCDKIDNAIFILTIKYGAMDLLSILADLEPTLQKESKALHAILEKKTKQHSIE